MDLFRSQHSLPGQQQTQNAGIPQVSPPVASNRMTNVGKTQLEKHAVKMRQLADAMVTSHKQSGSNATGAAIPHRSTTSISPAAKRAKFIRDAPTMGYVSPTGSNPTWRQKAMDRLIDTFRSRAPAASPSTASYLRMENDIDIVHELDQDVARALVYAGGKVMGIRPEELYNSPGLQKLVARNMEWFKNTPDWIKLIGLCAAKKLNGYLLPTPPEPPQQFCAFLQTSSSSSSSEFPPPPQPPTPESEEPHVMVVDEEEAVVVIKEEPTEESTAIAPDLLSVSPVIMKTKEMKEKKENKEKKNTSTTTAKKTKTDAPRASSSKKPSSKKRARPEEEDATKEEEAVITSAVSTAVEETGLSASAPILVI